MCPPKMHEHNTHYIKLCFISRKCGIVLFTVVIHTSWKLDQDTLIEHSLAPICDCLSKNPACSHKHAYNIEKIKIKNNLFHKLQRKNTQVFIRPLLREGRLKSIKTIHHLIHLFMGSSKICFVPVAPTVCMLQSQFESSCQWMLNKFGMLMMHVLGRLYQWWQHVCTVGPFGYFINAQRPGQLLRRSYFLILNNCLLVLG